MIDISNKDNLRDVMITHSNTGKKLRTPVRASIPVPESKGDKAVIDYILDSFKQKMPRLIPFTFENQSLINMATNMKRYTTGSPQTLYQYTFGIHRFCEWINRTPDDLVFGCKKSEDEIIPKQVKQIKKEIEEFIGDLQAEGLAPGTIKNHVKGVKALFDKNGVPIALPRLSKRVVYKDRAPSPDEIQTIIDLGDIREKVIVSILALTGLRVGTLVQLEYRHVMKDYEKGITPIHIHVESEITKGKYGDYDTFIGEEAIQYLRTYLKTRERGTSKMPLEQLTYNSPLIRDSHSKKPKPITPGRIHTIINSLYKKAGLISQSPQKRYKLRAHSLRKYFRTQLAALGTINTDYIEYMMGHQTSTYHDIESLGKETLRNHYATSGLSIKPKTQFDEYEKMATLARALNLDPNKVINKEAMLKPHRTILDPHQLKQEKIAILSKAVKETLLESVAKNIT